MHGMASAKCNTPWEQMEGDEFLRTCPHCNRKVYETAGVDHESVIKLIVDVESERDMKQIKLYRRQDGRLMSRQSYCTIAALLGRLYSWPVVVAVFAGLITLVSIGAHNSEQGYVMVFAMNVSYGLFIVLESALRLIGVDFHSKGKLYALRVGLGVVSTLAIAVYALLCLLHVPIWTFNKTALANFYLFGFLACAILRGVVIKYAENRKARIGKKLV
jgi:hypothetical protein